MSKQREALKLALDALDCIFSPLHVREINKVGAAMGAIREALAEPEQEPVAYLSIDSIGEHYLYFSKPLANDPAFPLYTTPPTRKPLTDEQIFEFADASLYEGGKNFGILQFARAIERAHGIIND